MFITVLLFLVLPLHFNDNYVFSLFYETYPHYKKNEVLNTCISGLSPLTHTIEILDDSSERKSFCLKNPWRTTFWIIEECDDILCREIEIIS